MNRREAVLRLLDNSRDPVAGYTPAAFFLHFDTGHLLGRAAVQKHREFFCYTGMDFVKIQYERKFPMVPMRTPIEWAALPLLDTAYFAPQLEAVQGLVEALKSEAPVVVTLYSPFMCAGQIAGQPTLTAHLEENPEAVAKGLEIVTESLLVFVRECIRLGVDGFYHSTQGGESGRFSNPALFADYIKPFDLQVMREIERHCPFNILHICDYHRDEYGGYDDLTPYRDYPGHVVNCSPQVGDRVLTGKEIAALFGRPFMGGMDRKGVLATGTQEEVRAAVREALKTLPERAILAADCTVPAGTPWENLRAAIAEAHGEGKGTFLTLNPSPNGKGLTGIDSPLP